MQGEAEMYSTEMSSAYEELLRTLITDARTTVSEITGYDCSDMPFVFGLPHWNPAHPNTPPFQDAVRNAMTKVANDTSFVNAAYVDCKGLAQHDMWHFTAAGQKYLGENFIDRLKNLNEGYTSDFEEKISINSDIKLLPSEKGLEVTANLTEHKVEKEHEYGILFMPTKDLNTNNITNDFVNLMEDNNISYNDIKCEIHGEENGEYYDISLVGSLKNISYQDFNTEYTIVAYIKDSSNSYLYSSSHISTSLASLASEKLYTETENLEEIKKIVDAGVNLEFNVDEEDAYKNSSLKLLIPNELSVSYSQTAKPTNLELTLQPSLPYYVKYTSSNPEVVSVDESGNLYTHKLGNVTITIECGGKTKTIDVIVNPDVIDDVTYDAVVSADEYAGEVVTKSNGKTTAKIYGMVANKNIHLALEITHNNWSEATRIWH